LEDNNTLNIISIIAIGTLGMLLLVSFIVLFIVTHKKKMAEKDQKMQQAKLEYQQSLLQSSLLAEEKERERLSKNVHDEVGALISLLNMNLSRIKMKSEGLEAVMPLVEEQKELLKSTSDIIRNVSKELASPMLLKFGYIEGLKDLLKTIEETAEIDIVFDCSNENYRFKTNDEVQLFRVTKELLNNLLKYALPKQINLTLLGAQNELVLTIHHNGKGITQQEFNSLSKSSNGLGLKSIQSRVQALDGSLHFNQQENQHYSITLKIPFDYEHAH
jgi:signal transduction histidine kinase